MKLSAGAFLCLVGFGLLTGASWAANPATAPATGPASADFWLDRVAADVRASLAAPGQLDGYSTDFAVWLWDIRGTDADRQLVVDVARRWERDVEGAPPSRRLNLLTHAIISYSVSGDDARAKLVFAQLEEERRKPRPATEPSKWPDTMVGYALAYMGLFDRLGELGLSSYTLCGLAEELDLAHRPKDARRVLAIARKTHRPTTSVADGYDPSWHRRALIESLIRLDELAEAETEAAATPAVSNSAALWMVVAHAYREKADAAGYARCCGAAIQCAEQSVSEWRAYVDVAEGAAAAGDYNLVQRVAGLFDEGKMDHHTAARCFAVLARCHIAFGKRAAFEESARISEKHLAQIDDLPVFRSEATMALAVAHARAGNQAKVDEIVRTVMPTTQPGNGFDGDIARVALAYAAAGQYERAVTTMGKAGSSYRQYGAIAAYAARAGRFDEARRIALHEAEIDRPRAMRYIAVAQFKAGQVDKALACLDQMGSPRERAVCELGIALSILGVPDTGLLAVNRFELDP